jgi:hypothetical protein
MRKLSAGFRAKVWTRKLPHTEHNYFLYVGESWSQVLHFAQLWVVSANWLHCKLLLSERSHCQFFASSRSLLCPPASSFLLPHRFQPSAPASYTPHFFCMYVYMCVCLRSSVCGPTTTYTSSGMFDNFRPRASRVPATRRVRYNWRLFEALSSNAPPSPPPTSTLPMSNGTLISLQVLQRWYRTRFRSPGDYNYVSNYTWQRSTV